MSGLPRTPEQRLAQFGVIRQIYGPGSGPRDGMSGLPLPTVRASSFAALPAPQRAFLDSGQLLPERNVTMLSGDGGTGKSLLALQLAAATVLGSTWLGLDVGQGPVLYLSAEDDLDETHARLKDIAASDDIDLAKLGSLEIAAMAGRDAVLAVETVKGATIRTTPLFERLVLNLNLLQPRLLILDNLADIFAGNENVRPLARQFVTQLRPLAIDHNCVVLLLAHPSLSGLTSGSGTSGNTAWNNSVRSRLYLVRDRDADGIETDPDRRLLQTMKANYGPTGGQMELRWQAGRFIRTDKPTNGLTAASLAHKAERIFLHLLRWHVAKNKPVSPAKSPTYAPAMFAKHPQSEGIKSRQFETAMNALLEQDRIVIKEIGPQSRLRRVLALASPEADRDDS